METSCAVNYAFLFMGLFIDDGFGIWLTLKEGSVNALKEFNN